MGLHPRAAARVRSGRADGRFSLCRTRVARTDRHPRRRPEPRYRAILTGTTLIAALLMTLAIWPRETVTLPEMGLFGTAPQAPAGTRYTLDDLVARLH